MVTFRDRTRGGQIVAERENWIAAGGLIISFAMHLPELRFNRRQSIAKVAWKSVTMRRFRSTLNDRQGVALLHDRKTN